MEYGYIRSATKDRKSLDEQIKTLTSYGVVNIVEEKSSYDLDSLLSRLQAGDVLRVTSIERLTRNSKKLIKIIKYTKEKGIIIYIGNQMLEMPLSLTKLLKEAGYEF